jgi:hypothetical protein
MQATTGTRLTAAAVTAVFLALAGTAYAAVPLTRVSSDPYDNPDSQHATEVEPDTFADHGVVVATFQVGRYFNGGSTNIGFARSGDGGFTWGPPGFLPGITFTAGAATNPFERVSDPSVAYDAAHDVWLISSLPLRSDLSSPRVAISRSTDDGVTWKKPVLIPRPAGPSDLDKNWTVCDDTKKSPFYGHCYTTFDNPADDGRLLTSTSTDGGLTWSVPAPTAGNDRGIGGQPLVQPDGTVIVPVATFPNRMSAYRSTDGGATWTAATKIGTPIVHTSAGPVRGGGMLPSAEMDNAGNVFVMWSDCHFRAGCSSNDIVYKTSSDGVSWSTLTRVPIDDTSSGADHFVPGLGVARGPSSSGPTAKLALTYYFYPVADCGNIGCQLEVGFISSPDAGAHWSSPITLAGPMSLDDLPNTTLGRMVGDYISTSFVNGKATTVFPVGLPHTGAFDEAMYAPATPLTIGSVSALNTTHSSDRLTTAESASRRHGKVRRTVPRRRR